MSSGIDRSAYLGAFREEMGEHLQGLSEGLLSLENHPDEHASLGEVFRHAHTIKGSARMMGFDAVADVAHAMEDVLADLRAGKQHVNPPLLDALLSSVDLLKSLMAPSGGGSSSQGEVQSLLERVKAFKASDGGFGAPLAGRLSASPMAEGEHFPARGLTSNRLEDIDTTSRAALVPGPTSPGSSGTQVAPAKAARRETVRIDVERIDTVLNLAGELTVLDGARKQWSDEVAQLVATLDRVKAAARKGDLRAVVEEADRLAETAAVGAKGYRRSASQETEVIRELHHHVSALRMLPIRAIFSLVPRVARDLARDQGKEIEVLVEGEDTEIDREVLERVRDSVLHLVRNAVDHGIESPSQRMAAGKRRAGTLRVAASSRGEQATLEVEDDGTGVNLRSVRDAAIRQGLVSAGEGESLDEEEGIKLLFLPGFSTRPVVSDTSGRGVGLDVVRSQVDALKGSVRLESRPGRGAKVTLELPITLAFTHVLLFRVGRSILGVRCTSVRGIILVPVNSALRLQGREAVDVGGRTVPRVGMQRLLGLEGAAPQEAQQSPALLLGPPERPVAFLVDEVIGDDNAIVKPLGPLLRGVPNVTGGIILGSGRIALLLSASRLVDSVHGGDAASPPRQPRAATSRRGRRVLVVEDSATTRELERCILAAAGYQVATAVDGHDALQKLRSQEFALVVTDVQMPGMDGFDLVAAIRGDGSLTRIPVVVVSSMESDEYRRRGLEVGAQAYLGKGSFDQASLLDTIEALIG